MHLWDILPGWPLVLEEIKAYSEETLQKTSAQESLSVSALFLKFCFCFCRCSHLYLCFRREKEGKERNEAKV